MYLNICPDRDVRKNSSCCESYLPVRQIPKPWRVSIDLLMHPYNNMNMAIVHCDDGCDNATTTIMRAMYHVTTKRDKNGKISKSKTQLDTIMKAADEFEYDEQVASNNRIIICGSSSTRSDINHQSFAERAQRFL